MNRADHIITVSNLTRQTVIEKYGIDPAKVTTVHNAVEPLSPEIMAIQMPHNPKEKVVTFLGRITMQKGPEYFVEAAAQVLRKTDHVRFVMAGSGDMMNKMICLAAQRNISDHFHFTGFLRGKQVYEMLKASDVYVMPSVSEPSGISPLEAMQVGVPSIISETIGLRRDSQSMSSRSTIGTCKRWPMLYIRSLLILRCTDNSKKRVNEKSMR